ncbi:sulfurtransferase TusA family protein [Acetobacter fallax]|uniref:Sulfurtransferase TusA family protein n=1 Tax=Acetobacter fallax TaxID=1737473 RepID=A0ABX0K7S2_9PROT|nr:sulfurtransferase TusA family protein [Acetobacter fallax]NHO31529.1 sulfurtransferase TusA family protein [Acetobacter fallax]NHO35088.1 sulfurtransferase TusA family protein [Acetobacter fallax]
MTNAVPYASGNQSAPARWLDITGEICPMTFVRTRLALDALETGDLLHVTLRGAEPLRNVRRSAEALGHIILSQEKMTDDRAVLLILKA